MQILLSRPVVKKIRRELRRSGRREIGGLLMGEHVQEDIFSVVEISVQRKGGSPIHFVRQPKEHQTQLDRFFVRTGADYQRFNYLGEWHSHPGFETSPSCTDICTMQSIVDDPAVGANFLVLMIPKLGNTDALDLMAVVVRRGGDPFNATVSVEGEVWTDGVVRRCLRRIFEPRT